MEIECLTPIGRLLDRLAPLDPESRVDAILGEIATGPDNLCDITMSCDKCLTMIQLHGVIASGMDLATACHCWIASAQEIAPGIEALARAEQTLADTTAAGPQIVAACANILSNSTCTVMREIARARLHSLGQSAGA